MASTPPFPLPRIKLRSFEVRNFRLFRHERLELHPEVTVLVGGNDVGKSTLLRALFTYGRTSLEGFRVALRSKQELGTGPEAAQFTAEWGVGEERWTHHITLDPARPEEKFEHGDAWWSWDAKACRLDSNAGAFSLDPGFRLSTLAQFDERRWQVDTNVPPEVYGPLSVTQRFRTTRPYFFQPHALASPVSVDVETPGPDGRGWAVWLQQLVNRRDDTLSKVEATLRELFPFFGRVRVREEKSPSFDLMSEMFSIFDPASTADFRALLRDGLLQRATKGGDLSDEKYRNFRSQEVIFELQDPNGSHEGPPPSLGAEDVSSGLLLALVHLVASYALIDTPLVLLEEPENGLNRRIMLDMMRAILAAYRERGHQLVMTTHHGWWLDLVPPEAIRVLTRDETGGHVRSPDPSALRHALDELDLYPSEVMNTYGPEGLLHDLGGEAGRGG